MRGEDGELVSLRTQIQTLEEQAQSHAEKEQMFQNRAEELRELLTEANAERESNIEAARENLQGTPKDPANPAIKRWADRVGMTPDQLCEELEQGHNSIQ
jgi:chromosome segregation ATPase